MTPAARLGYLRRRLNLHLHPLVLAAGASFVGLGDSVTQVEGACVRATLSDGAGRLDGRASSTSAAVLGDALLALDIFWPDRERSSVAASIYGAADCADRLVDALTRMELQVYDYADPHNPVAVDGAWYRTSEPPTTRSLPPEDGFDRMQVVVPILWHYPHSDA